MTIAINVFGAEDGVQTIPLAAAIGVGARDELVGADSHRFDRLEAEVEGRWRSAFENEAEVFVYAHDYRPSAADHPAVSVARDRGKPVVFFQDSDNAAPREPGYGVVYADSIYASQMTPAERALPAFADDLAREVGGLTVREKQQRPSVGFCGFVGSAWKRALFRLQGRGEKVVGLALRNRALRLLERSQRVDANFVRRTAFWGGAIGRLRGPDWEAKQRVREEYLANITDSDYTLCLRGAGNFSYRLYETLALGRVPLFVNTDCALPFPDQIDWPRHVVWVEEAELATIGDRLAEFHAALSPEEFAELQRSNRRIWEEYLRPTECYQRILEAEIAAMA